MRTGQTSSHEVDSSEEPLQACDYGGFAGSLLSRRVVDAGVLPDERMFWGAADLEFWLRVRAAGFRILVDAAAHRASTDKGSSGESWCGYYIARNGFHLGRRYGSPRWILLHLVKTVRRFQLAPSTAHRIAIARGLVDGIRGRTGRNPEFAR
jgi:GT2 family glycosyltransferase